MATETLMEYLTKSDFLGRMIRSDNLLHIPEMVFAMLDRRSRMAARQVSASWKQFADQKYPLWRRYGHKHKSSF